MAETTTASEDIRSVYVANISPSATEKTVSDFFSFCGKIVKLFLKKEDGKDTSAAVIEFETESAAKTALLLTNALIVDRPITVSPYASGQTQQTSIPSTANLAPVDSSNITYRDFGDVPDDQRTKTSTVASLLAAGYVLASDALDQAKAYDERHNISLRAKVAVEQIKVKAHEIDVQYGITDKATAAKNSVVETTKKLDNDYHISEKASQAAASLVATAQTGLAKAQENATVKKATDSVKQTALNVSTAVNTAVNDYKQQTQKAIEEKQKAKTTTTTTPVDVPITSTAPQTEPLDPTPVQDIPPQ